MIKYLDYLYITRPILFFPGWATLFIGRWLAAFRFSDGGYGLFESIYPGIIHLYLLGGFACLMGSSFILNQIRDADSDRINKKLFFIHNDIIKLKSAWIEAAILFLVGFVFLILADNLFILACGIIFYTVTAYLYNFRPFELKNSIVGGLLANMLMGECAFAIGYFSYGSNVLEFMLVDSLGILLINTGLFIFTTLPDISGDKASNKKTIGIWLGPKIGTIMGTILIISGFLLLPLNILWVWLLAVFTLPFLIYALIKPEIKNAVVAMKITIFMLSFLVALYWPWFLILGLLAFWGTKIYFRKRFSLDYPNFSGS